MNTTLKTFGMENCTLNIQAVMTYNLRYKTFLLLGPPMVNRSIMLTFLQPFSSKGRGFKYRFFYKPYIQLFEPLSTDFAAQKTQTKVLQ